MLAVSVSIEENNEIVNFSTMVPSCGNVHTENQPQNRLYVWGKAKQLSKIHCVIIMIISPYQSIFSVH